MYLLDANIFIQAKNRHYAFDVVPGFWRWLERAHGIGIAGSVEGGRARLALLRAALVEPGPSKPFRDGGALASAAPPSGFCYALKAP